MLKTENSSLSWIITIPGRNWVAEKAMPFSSLLA
jgi:hypothetical protein